MIKTLQNVENTLIAHEEKVEEVSTFGLTNFAKYITGGETEDNIDEWTNCDANDSCFEHLIDEIVGGALGIVSTFGK